jgi:ribosomal-protein-alanine N-acetyltransferase
MRFDKTLGTSDVLLRQLEIYDITEKYINWLNDPEINEFMDVRINPPNAEEQKNYVRECINSEDKILFGIFENYIEMIGTLKVTFIDPSSIEVGIMIGEKSKQGIGVGKKSLNLVIAWAFKISLLTISAGYEIHNISSMKLFESLGFEKISRVTKLNMNNESIIIEKVSLSLQKR